MDFREEIVKYLNEENFTAVVESISSKLKNGENVRFITTSDVQYIVLLEEFVLIRLNFVQNSKWVAEITILNNRIDIDDVKNNAQELLSSIQEKANPEGMSAEKAYYGRLMRQINGM